MAASPKKKCAQWRFGLAIASCRTSEAQEFQEPCGKRRVRTWRSKRRVVDIVKNATESENSDATFSLVLCRPNVQRPPPLPPPLPPPPTLARRSFQVVDRAICCARRHFSIRKVERFGLCACTIVYFCTAQNSLAFACGKCQFGRSYSHDVICRRCFVCVVKIF